MAFKDHTDQMGDDCWGRQGRTQHWVLPQSVKTWGIPVQKDITGLLIGLDWAAASDTVAVPDPAGVNPVWGH